MTGLQIGLGVAMAAVCLALDLVEGCHGYTTLFLIAWSLLATMRSWGYRRLYEEERQRKRYKSH